MNKMTKRSIRDRIRDIIRAAQGKPKDHITVGLELKHCKDCERGDCNTCGIKCYFELVSVLPDCNTCGNKDCPYRPRIGQQVRIHCPFWRPDK